MNTTLKLDKDEVIKVLIDYAKKTNPRFDDNKSNQGIVIDIDISKEGETPPKQGLKSISITVKHK